MDGPSFREFPPLAYDLRGLAVALSLSYRTVQAIVARGEIPSCTAGRRRLVRRVDAEAFLAARVAADRNTRANKGVPAA